jgi:hypothetical protein
MTTHTEAMSEFTKNATAFIEQLPLLTKARDADEEDLRTLMTQLEQGVNVLGIKPAPEKKSPQPANVEAIRRADQGSGRIMTRFSVKGRRLEAFVSDPPARLLSSLSSQIQEVL